MSVPDEGSTPAVSHVGAILAKIRANDTGHSSVGARFSFANLCSLMAWLPPGNLEEAKAWVCRFCEHETTLCEADVVARLVSLGLLPYDADERWGSVLDLEVVVANARLKSSSQSSRAFRKPAAFRTVEEPQRPARPHANGDRAEAATGEVDASESDSAQLLRRLRKQSTRGLSARDADDFRVTLYRAALSDVSLTEVDFSSRADFSALPAEHKAEAIMHLASASRDGSLEDVALDGLALDLSCAEALAQLLQSPKLRRVSLSSNRLNESAIQRIARAIHHHPALEAISIADQNGTALSTYSIGQLLDGMEACPTLAKLRVGHIHDDALRRRYVRVETAHVEQMRRRHAGLALGDESTISSGPQSAKAVVASSGAAPTAAASEARQSPVTNAGAAAAAAGGGGGGGGVGSRSAVSSLPSHWMAEAARIAATAPTTLGTPDNSRSGAQWRDPQTHYILTGSSEWQMATKEERRAVIEAFASNTQFTTVSMSDSLVDDDLARSWASVLANPSCHVTSLSLESNPITSAGVEAIASALPSNTSLGELRLRNLHAKVAAEAEEALANALEGHASLTKLYMDMRSHRAKDLVGRHLAQNERRRREDKGWGNGPTPAFRPPAAPPPPTATTSVDASAGAAALEGGRPRARGAHVKSARDLWDGFFTHAHTAATRSDWADAVDEANGAGMGGGAAKRTVLYDPSSLPEVDMGADALRAASALPYVGLSSVSTGAVEAAGEKRQGQIREEQPVASMGGGSSSGPVARPNMGNVAADAMAVALRGRDKKAAAVSALEARRTKMTSLASRSKKSNPIAHRAAEAAAENEEAVLVAVVALEEKKATQQKEVAEKKARSQRLAFMLEATGEIMHSFRHRVASPNSSSGNSSRQGTGRGTQPPTATSAGAPMPAHPESPPESARGKKRSLTPRKAAEPEPANIFAAVAARRAQLMGDLEA